MPNAVGLACCFWAALAFAGLCLGVALMEWATKRQAQASAEKYRLTSAELSRRLGREYKAHAAARAELEALRRKGAA